MSSARTLRELYDPAQEGIAFAIDGFAPDGVLEALLKKGIVGQTSNQPLLLQRLKDGALDEDILRLHRQGLSPRDFKSPL
ncbi:MAG: hypothetical protein ACUVTP_02710 [Candidatus Fervidibacter sp.]|uniref:hypothetical protein n=1 Tax=Candidatus Fervidibacter sp. TaxID=3100871 RepID=UPI00404AD99E